MSNNKAWSWLRSSVGFELQRPDLTETIESTSVHGAPMECRPDFAVLFLIFNRLDTTIQVFERIREARPKRFYVAADGPRPKEGEKEACEAVRRIIDGVDWECEVHKLFRDENLGCKVAISSAIEWFFQEEEMGIILEDDCVPDPSFFPYCCALLDRYKDNPRVMMIAGTNPLKKVGDLKDAYFFSRYYEIWGWATWRRAWDQYDVEMRRWPEFYQSKKMEWIYGEKLGTLLKEMFQSVFMGRIDTWDCQWFFACMRNDGLCIVPRNNLISNIGVQGLHFKGEKNPRLMMRTTQVEISEGMPPVEANLRLEKRLFAAMSITPNYYVVGLRYRLKGILRKINPSRSEGIQMGWLLRLAWNI